MFIAPVRPEATCDLECFHNWFLIGITDRVTKVRWEYQLFPWTKLDVAAVEVLLQHFTIVTFNGNNYDVLMLIMALSGATCEQLKSANDAIITQGLKPWDFYKRYGLRVPPYLDHIDVMEPTPGVRVGLKQYACRMHSRLVQDSPVDFKVPLPMEHVLDEIAYCGNDREITGELRAEIDERIKLRVIMSNRYGVDLRSKSDAQMAEAMVKSEWSRLMRDSLERWNAEETGAVVSDDRYWHHGVDFTIDWQGNPKVIIPKYAHGTTFKARIPEYVEFATPYMNALLTDVRNCDFFISDREEAEELGLESTDGKKIKTGVLIPKILKGRDIVIGQTTYRVGIGGLHSQESSVTYRSVAGKQRLRTADVKSYYPSLILNAGMYPPQLGPLFLEIYNTVYVERLDAKAALASMSKDAQRYLEVAAVEGGFKIVLNGTFGKLFSRYSIFYAPEFGIAVTIGGQLSLLMLIERLELSGIRVVSANTDGIEMLIPEGREWIVDSIMDWWQKATKLGMDQKDYASLHARDVNNYISIESDGKVKRKGVFGESGVLKNKHPDLDICADAVVAFLSRGVPLRDTITACTDVRKFIRVRGAKGGAAVASTDSSLLVVGHVSDGLNQIPVTRRAHGPNLGRAVRWYYASNSNDYLVDVGSGNKVAGSDGCQTIMELPETLPDNIDYAYYVEVAAGMLEDVGMAA